MLIVLSQLHSHSITDKGRVIVIHRPIHVEGKNVYKLTTQAHLIPYINALPER